MANNEHRYNLGTLGLRLNHNHHKRWHKPECPKYSLYEIYELEMNVHRISELRYRKKNLRKSEIRGTIVKLALVFIGIHLK